MDMVSRKKSSCEGDGDRISHLPDEILCYILSFIPTIYSVTTCILSKRWQHVWKYVPKLNFDVCLMPSPQTERFANFVNSVLRAHTQKVKVLEKFSLKCEEMDHLCDATKWISSSVLRNIKSLDLNIRSLNRTRLKLPNCIFSCKSLESLMLNGNILFNVPSHVCLPKLKTLELVSLAYQDDPLILISLCPSLEYLHLERYTRARSNFFIGSNRQMLSSTLRHIKLINAIAPKVVVPSNVFTLQTLEKLSLQGFLFSCALPTISMPNLTFLELVEVKYQDDQIFSTLISSCTSLETLNVDNLLEAELNISSCTVKGIELKLICGVNTGHHKLVINAPALKYFKLNIVRGMIDYYIEELALLEEAVVTISFDSGISHDYCSSSLMDIYKALQHVKSLKVKHNFPTGLCGVSWNNPNCVPACLLTSLRSVSITSFRGGVGVTLMAKYFIENARILEKMEVCFDRCSTKRIPKSKSRQKLISFCRASQKCIVLSIK